MVISLVSEAGYQRWNAWSCASTSPLPASISEPVLKGGGYAMAGATARPMEKA